MDSRLMKKCKLLIRVDQILCGADKSVVLKLCAVEHTQVCRENILKILKVCFF